MIDKIIKETNEYAKRKISEKQLSRKSIWHSWVDVTREEFMAFIGVILNMGTMPLASIVKYWSIRFNSRIPFYSEVFIRNRFREIFWMLHSQSDVSEKRSIRTHTEKANKW